MKKFKIGKITKPLDLREYDPSLEAEEGIEPVIHVWVNPPMDMQQRFFEIAGHVDANAARIKENQAVIDKFLKDEAEILTKWARDHPDEDYPVGPVLPHEPKAITEAAEKWNDELFGWFAEIWSQHADAETHWSGEEVRALVLGSRETEGDAFWRWLTSKTQDLIRDHRYLQQKK